MSHIVCEKCGVDLISIRMDVWECPRCGTDYEVSDLSGLSFGDGGDTDVEVKRKKSRGRSFIVWIIWILLIIIGILIKFFASGW